MAKLVLTGGGTAGHCIPHLAILPYLKKDFDDIIYIGSKSGMEKNIIEREKITYYGVNSAKLKRNFSADNLLIPFKLLSGISEAKKILKKFKPDVVFSKGGYVSLPTVIAAHSLSIPVIAHESDYSAGLTNKISARYCEKVLTSFSVTEKEFKNGKFVGAPIRKPDKNITKKDAISSFGFSGNKPVLLITGGSLGATAINNALKKALPLLLPTFDIIHVCGKGNLSKIKKEGYYETEFLPDMYRAFTACSVCVSRAGSNTVFEIMNYKIPSLLIPLPKGASRGDQILNASYFLKKGLASVLYQQDLTPNSLVSEINAVYSNRFNFSRNFSFSPVADASPVIAEIIVRYIH